MHRYIKDSPTLFPTEDTGLVQLLCDVEGGIRDGLDHFQTNIQSR